MRPEHSPHQKPLYIIMCWSVYCEGRSVGRIGNTFRPAAVYIDEFTFFSGDVMENNLQEIFSSFDGKKSELIPLLQKTQESLGYLPEDAMLEIAKFTRVPEAQVYAVATFYSQFRFSPIGKNHIMLCRGTACHVQGAPRILDEVERQLGIKEGETTEDGEFSLETVACIGACGLAPTIVVNKDTHGRLDAKKVSKILKSISSEKEG